MMTREAVRIWGLNRKTGQWRHAPLLTVKTAHWANMNVSGMNLTVLA